jgi:hypothetical protein
MHLAMKLGKSMEETERLTAMEFSAWRQLDRPAAPQRPTGIEDFWAAVKTRRTRRW